MNIRILFFGILMIMTFGCYEDPFFKLNVNVVDQNLAPVENAEVINGKCTVTSSPPLEPQWLRRFWPRHRRDPKAPLTP